MLQNLSWFVIKETLKDVPGWCVKNWKFFLGLAIPIMVIMTGYACNNDIKRIYGDLLSDKDKEIVITIDSGEKLSDEKEKQREEHKKRVEKIKEAHEKAEVKLSGEKEAEIEALVEKYMDNPTGMAEELSKISGIPIVIYNE